jgi:hypothetical protein
MSSANGYQPTDRHHAGGNTADFSEQGPMGHCSPRSSGDTALHMACRYGAIESVEALLEAGADPNAR